MARKNGDVIPMRKAPQKIKISEEQKAEIIALNNEVVTAKIAIADAALELDVAERRLSETTKNFRSAFQNYQERIANIGRDLQIPVDDPSKGHWVFDGEFFTKTR